MVATSHQRGEMVATSHQRGEMVTTALETRGGRWPQPCRWTAFTAHGVHTVRYQHKVEVLHTPRKAGYADGASTGQHSTGQGNTRLRRAVHGDTAQSRAVHGCNAGQC